MLVLLVQYWEPGMNGDPNVGNDLSNIGNQG